MSRKQSGKPPVKRTRAEEARADAAAARKRQKERPTMNDDEVDEAIAASISKPDGPAPPPSSSESASSASSSSSSSDDSDSDEDPSDSNSEQDEVFQSSKALSRKKRDASASAKRKANKPKAKGSASKKGKRPAAKKSPSAAAARKKKKGRKSKATSALFPALASKTSPSAIAADLLKHFKSRPDRAQRDMINLLLRCSGLYSVQLSNQDDVDATDEFESRFKTGGEYLEALKEDIRTAGTYPVAGKSKDDKHLVKRYDKFWAKVVDVCCSGPKPNINVEDGLIDSAIQWMSIFGNAKAYPFRHAASIAAMALGTALVKRGKDLDIKLLANNNKASGEIKGRKAKSKPAVANAATLKSGAAIKKKLDATMERLHLIWTEIFRGRYRDTNSVVRQLCMKTLLNWTKIYPEKFVATEYLKHVGWLLSDQSKDVRRAAFAAAKEVFTASNKVLGKRQAAARQGFLGKFIPRIFEATSDVDPQVTIKALDILTFLYDKGFLEGLNGDGPDSNFLTDDRLNHVFQKIFDDTSRAVRVAAAKFTTSQYSQFDTAQQAAAAKEAKKKDEIARREAKKKEKLKAKKKDKAGDKDKEDDDSDKESDDSGGSDVEVDELDELSFEAQDAQAMDLHEKQIGILMNCLDQAGGDASYVGHVVDAFWGLPRVVCLTDLSRQITSLVTEADDDDAVDENDITVQMYILRECIRKTCRKGEFMPSGRANFTKSGRDPNLIGDGSPVARTSSSFSTAAGDVRGNCDMLSDEASEILMRSMPALLRRYKDDAERIEVLGELPQYLSLSTVSAVKFQSLFKDLLVALRMTIRTFGSNRVKGAVADATAAAKEHKWNDDDAGSSDADGEPLASGEEQEHLQNILSTKIQRRLDEITDTGGSHVLDILVRSFNHLSGADSATCKREARAQTRVLVAEVAKTFRAAVGQLSTSSTTDDQDMADEDPGFAACLSLLRLYKLSQFCHAAEGIFPDDLFDQVSEFCRQQLDDLAAMRHVHSVAVAFGLRFLHQMSQWALMSTMDSEADKPTISENGKPKPSLSAAVISSPSMIVDEDEDADDLMAKSPERSNGRGIGGTAAAQEELSASAQDTLKKRNTLLTHIQFVLQNFAKANKGRRVSGHLGGKQMGGGREDSLDSDFDELDDDDSRDAMNSSRNWLLSPGKAQRALYPILSHAFTVFTDMTVLYTDRFRSENYCLRELSWYPSKQVSSAARYALETLVGHDHDTLLRMTNSDPADLSLTETALSATAMQGAFEQEIVLQYMAPALRTFVCASIYRPEPDLKLPACVLRLCLLPNHKGSFADFAKSLCDQIKPLGRTLSVTTPEEQAKGFKILLDIQKLTLRMHHNELVSRSKKMTKSALFESMESMATRLAKMLGTHASNKVVAVRQTLLVAFSLDGILHGITGKNAAVFLTTIQPYLLHLKPASVMQLVNILEEKTTDISNKIHVFKSAAYLELKKVLQKRIKRPVNLGSASWRSNSPDSSKSGSSARNRSSPASVSNVSEGLENDEIEPVSSEDDSFQDSSLSRKTNNGRSIAGIISSREVASNGNKRNGKKKDAGMASDVSSLSDEDGDEEMSEAMSAQSLDVSAISSAMSEDDQDSDADSGFDSRRKSSGKKRKQRSLSSRFKSSIQKSRKPSLANVQEVQSDYEEDSPAARDASRANMSSDFASSGVDSNPSSPVISSRSSKSAVDMSDSDGIGHADNTGARKVSDAVPQPEQSKPKKKRRRRGNY